MKNIKIISVLILSIAIGGCVTQKHIPVEETAVINIPGKDKKTIYHKARQWFSEYFTSGKSVVDYEDKEAGTVIGKGNTQIGSDPFGLIGYHIKFSVRIDVKDGKFRALTKVLSHYNVDSTSIYDVSYVSEDRKALAEARVHQVVQDIEKYINSNNKAKSNW